ncbi:MAG: hypothetical protein CMJ31_10505 [Phycisphaerae bacterium]|nr:hypothetical protein [Phycisphaerae bacterium]
MKNSIALVAVAGIAAAATAQTATVTVNPSATMIDTTATDAASRTVSVTVTITGDNGLTTFDAVMDAVEGSGLFTTANPMLVNPLLFTAVAGVSEARVEGPIGVRAFGSGPLLSGTDISGQQFTFDLIANAGAVGTVDLTVVGSGFSDIATMGLFATAYDNVVVNNATITLVPAPASLALLGLGGLAATRRRR